MIDRKKLVTLFEHMVPGLLITKEQQFAVGVNVLKKLLKNPDILSAVFAKNEVVQLPKLLDEFKIFNVMHMHHAIPYYTTIGVDGSQIYPDKHEGFAYGLLNTGIVKIVYDSSSSVEFHTIPYLIDRPIIGDSLTVDLINCQRTEQEFIHGLRYAQYSGDFNNAIHERMQLVFFDGSLIFWHLNAKEDQIKQYFMQKYLEIFNTFFNKKLYYLSYISLPQSKDLVQIVKAAQQIIYSDQVQYDDLSDIVDADLLAECLPVGCRTTVFQHNNILAENYHDHNIPCFTYMHNGSEVIRVEFPAWMAQDMQLINILCCIIMDQCHKGAGYPIVLAEAHELAVIKASDRAFFYEMLRLSYNKHKNIHYRAKRSAKLTKKRYSIL